MSWVCGGAVAVEDALVTLSEAYLLVFAEEGLFLVFQVFGELAEERTEEDA